ncbi:MAG: sodium/proton-translocating pyrophosphatase [Phycisphaeraceae bacterium]|nr:sodium/proton-translocating pyrophosphatase [Phycisphaeraceae bacterium]
MLTAAGPVLATIDAIPPAYFVAPVGGIAALLMARVFASSVLKKSEGDEEMIRIAGAVREGAMAYLTRQYKVVGGVFVALVVFLGLLTAMKLQPWQSMMGVPIAGFLSGLCGWFGMRMATNASARTAAAAKQSLNETLTVAFDPGRSWRPERDGLCGLLDASAWFFIFNAMDADVRSHDDRSEASAAWARHAGMLFARVGGSIYTEADRRQRGPRPAGQARHSQGRRPQPGDDRR